VSVSPVPPSWEVLDEEAKARGMTISYEVEDGQGYVSYTSNTVQASYLDHPIGRLSAQEMFSKLDSEQS
jgi:hypothetical protein